MSAKVIRVQGSGKAGQSPDRITLYLDIAQVHESFTEAVDGCNSRVEGIRNAISEAELDPLDLKTISFLVEDAFEYQNDQRVRIGYEATHRTRFEMEFDQELVARVMTLISRSGYKPNVSTSFHISDREVLRRRVLEIAVGNATCRAEAIAHSAGLKLGAIQLMEHEAVGIPLSGTSVKTPEIFYSKSARYSHKDPDRTWTIEPQDVVAEATVLIAWELIEAPN